MAELGKIIRQAISVALASTWLSAGCLAAAAENRLVDFGGAAANVPAKAETGAMSTSLAPFEQPVDQTILSGEDDSLTLSFAASEAAAESGGVLRIGYTNAVSVLPDTARLEVEVNGKSVGMFAIRSPNGVKVEGIPLGPGMLKPGRNRVRLHAVQHHRVDCALDATYELWTRLSPADSGFLPAVPAGFSSPMDLIAVQKTKEGLTDLRLVIPDHADPVQIEQALPAIQSLGLALNRSDLLVSVAEAAGTGPGIDLYVGRTSAAGQGGKSGFTVRDGLTPGRAAVTVDGATPEAVEAALVNALSGPLKPALATGILAPQPGVLKGTASANYHLSDAGYRSRPFAGRLFRTRFEIDMPADFYPADYDSMDFYLSGATAPGLLPSAQFLVRVNDRVVTSFPFRDTGGQTFRDQRIELPLRAFRPGANRVELLAELPTAADAACRPAERQEDKPRFVLLEESRIEIPALARIGRLPDLSAFAGAAYPYADGKPFTLQVESQDARELSAALTTLARLSLAAGKPLSAKLAVGEPDALPTGNVLAVTLAGRTSAENTQPAIDPQVTSATGHAGEIFSTGSEKLIQAFETDASHVEDRPVSALAQAWIGRITDRFNSWLRYQDAPESALPAPEDRLVSISQSEAQDGRAIVTRIEAGSPDALARGFAALIRPDTWSRLSGGTAVIAADGLTLSTHSPATTFIHEMSDWSFGNLRRLAASWFSDNFQAYVALVFVLMGAFGLWLGFAVPKSGVRARK